MQSFKMLFCSSVSACFELNNDEVYYNDSEYSVLLNGAEYERGKKTNVFSVFNLLPNTKYTVSTTLSAFEIKFSTKEESVAVSVKDFGAVGDGVTNCTRAIQCAINTIAKNGRVVVPSGDYLVGALTLKSDMTLELQKGARIIGSTNEDDYPILPGKVTNLNDGEEYQIASWEGCPFNSHQALISAFRAENVSIVGEGVIDGNAQNAKWWINHRERKVGRPRLVFLNDCDNVVMHGITGKNAASWQFHPYFSRNISFYDTCVEAPKDSPNTDGCDPESCDRVNIIGMVFSVGDDCIAIKSGKMYMGAKYKTPASNHVIRNCLMQFGHGGVVLGSEMSGGVRSLTVERCLFNQTDRGLRIKTRRGRGKYAIIDNVEFKNIKMQGVLTPLVMNMYYFCDVDGKTEYVWSKEKQPVDDGTPYLGSFYFHDMECRDCAVSAGYFYGLPEMPIKSVKIENVSFVFKKNAEKGVPAMMSFIEPRSNEGLYFNFVDDVEIKNVSFENVVGEEIQTFNVKKTERI